MITQSISPITIDELITWHSNQRRLMMAGAMSLQDALPKARFHEAAIKLLNTIQQVTVDPTPHL